MPSEIELKLLLPHTAPEAAAPLLGASPALAGVQPRTQALLNRYFDTPSLTLRHHKAALRLRCIDGNPSSWLQTFKTAGTSVNGLSQRGEWETPVPGGQLSREALQATPWAEWDADGTLFAQLQPCFDTVCQRTVWLLELDQARIEVALDVGHVAVQGRTEAIVELELELLAGPTQALLDLAHTLGQVLPLVPSDVSKAQRGYALAQQA